MYISAIVFVSVIFILFIKIFNKDLIPSRWEEDEWDDGISETPEIKTVIIEEGTSFVDAIIDNSIDSDVSCFTTKELNTSLKGGTITGASEVGILENIITLSDSIPPYFVIFTNGKYTFYVFDRLESTTDYFY